MLSSGVIQRLSEITLKNRNRHMEWVIVSQWLGLAISEETKGRSTRTTAVITVFLSFFFPRLNKRCYFTQAGCVIW